MIFLFLALCSAVDFAVPWTAGQSYRITQDGRGCGWQGCSTCTQPGDHRNNGGQAIDFGMPANTIVRAAAAGRVLRVLIVVTPGQTCFNGALSCCGKNKSNYVVLLHADDSTTLYLHINQALVKVNDLVERGQPIAKSGSTGCSTGPHLHFQRGTNCGSYWCLTKPVRFVDWDGPLSVCTTVKSGNVPPSSPTLPPAMPSDSFCERKSNGAHCRSDTELVQCTGGQVSRSTPCQCMVHPPGQNDACQATAVPFCSGKVDGAYCRSDAELVQCAGGLVTNPIQCACKTNPPGQHDECADVPPTDCTLFSHDCMACNNRVGECQFCNGACQQTGACAASACAVIQPEAFDCKSLGSCDACVNGNGGGTCTFCGGQCVNTVFFLSQDTACPGGAQVPYECAAQSEGGRDKLYGTFCAGQETGLQCAARDDGNLHLCANGETQRVVLCMFGCSMTTNECLDGPCDLETKICDDGTVLTPRDDCTIKECLRVMVDEGDDLTKATSASWTLHGHEGGMVLLIVAGLAVRGQ